MLFILWRDCTDPNVPIVTDDDAGSTEHVVEMVLASFDKRRRDHQQTTFLQLRTTHKSHTHTHTHIRSHLPVFQTPCVKGERAIGKHLLNFSLHTHDMRYDAT